MEHFLFIYLFFYNEWRNFFSFVKATVWDFVFYFLQVLFPLLSSFVHIDEFVYWIVLTPVLILPRQETLVLLQIKPRRMFLSSFFITNIKLINVIVDTH
jgi:hypothetical protein